MPVTTSKKNNIASGELEISVTYFDTSSGTLEFGVMNIGELEYGYEDDDQLTFFPNVFRMEFTDFDKKNYIILKNSLEKYPDYSHEETGRVLVKLNGREIYDGYIEHETLTYNDETASTSFEAVDFVLELKNITTFDVNSDSELIDLPTVLFAIYKKIYPNMPEQIAHNPDIYNSPGYKGLIWEHNWKFKGKKKDMPPIECDWSTNYREPIFAFSHHFWQGHYPFNSLAELIKQLAKEFGAMIGSTEKNKVFFKKRFVADFGVKEFLDEKIISGTLSKTLHLRRIQSVTNDNAFLGPDKDAETIQGNFLKNPNREDIPQNTNNNLNIKSYLGSRLEYYNINEMRWKTNVQLKRNGIKYDVGNGIFDPDINGTSGKRIQALITYYTLKAREKNRDKYEMELFGTDYDIYKFYKLRYTSDKVQIVRPMVIKKDLLNNKTSMTALESEIAAGTNPIIINN